MRISNKMRGIVRIILSLLWFYSLIEVFSKYVTSKFNEPTEVVLGYLAGAVIILWLSVAMLLNGLSEFRFGRIKYKTYFASILCAIAFSYFLIEETLNRKDFSAIIFGVFLVLSFSYLAIYDFISFRRLGKKLNE